MDGTGWHARLSQVLDDPRKARTHALWFRARADVLRSMRVHGQVGEPDWHGFGLNETVPLTTEWQTYEREFRAKDLAASNML